MKTFSGIFGNTGADRGSAAVEFAVTLPILILVLAGIFDYSGAVGISTKLFSSTRAGVQYGLRYPGDSAGIAGVADASTLSTFEATTSYSVAAGTPTTYYYCYDTTTGQIDFTPETSSYDCRQGGKYPNMALGHFLQLSATTDPSTYNPMLQWGGLGASMSLSGQALIQVQ